MSIWHGEIQSPKGREYNDEAAKEQAASNRAAVQADGGKVTISKNFGMAPGMIVLILDDKKGKKPTDYQFDADIIWQEVDTEKSGEQGVVYKPAQPSRVGAGRNNDAVQQNVESQKEG